MCFCCGTDACIAAGAVNAGMCSRDSVLLCRGGGVQEGAGVVEDKDLG